MPESLKVVLDPFNDYATLDDLHEAIRYSGEIQEEVEPQEEAIPLKVLTHASQLAEDDDWKAAVEKSKSKPKVDPKLKGLKGKAAQKVAQEILKAAHNPSLSRWLQEDLSTGVVFVSLRDIACE